MHTHPSTLHTYTINAPRCQKLPLTRLNSDTRPFRYDLNQIPYDYTVEVTNRFKGLDLIDKSA